MLATKYIRESQESETLLIHEVSRLKANSGEKIFRFGFGQSPFLPPKQVSDALSSASLHKEYVSVQGLEELREAVATFHNHYDGLSVKSDNVLVAPGSKILIYAMLTAFDQADVMFVTPSWVSYEPQAKIAKLNRIRIRTSFESRWRLTPALLEEACAQRVNKDQPAILILNYPGNPDGLTYTESELKALADTFRKHNVLVISDEIYGLLNHDGNHTSLATYYPEGTIVTSGLSKWCGAGGWRLGIALLPETLPTAFKQSVIGIASETYSCAPVPVQYAGIQAYQISDEIEAYLKHKRRILSIAANYMYESLSAVNVKLHKPEGGFYLNPDFSNFRDRFKDKGINTNEAMCEAILNETSVVILPGSAFGYLPEDLTARIAYVDFNGAEAMAASKEIGLEKELDQAFLETYCPKIVEGTTRLADWLR